MYFKKIKMHGFKSFAEPVTIEFTQGITCIVGPNGSGKSNISDAIRWVLGEQSPKMLRGGKMEEVIFSGTAGRKSRGMAEVTLVIDNEDGSLPIDYKEVAITRRMFRSGESEYHINGNQCRLRDIRELIMDTGIGVDGYSLIGQGKISDILSNKTESRREIFEEAAGIVMYRTKKAESERKLTATTANMDRVKDIVGEIEGRIDGLREDSVKAKEYIKLRDRYKELEINIILKNVENLELKNEYMKDDLSELQMTIDTAKENRTELEQKLADLSSKSEALEAISVETREKLLAAIDELNTLVNKSEINKERLVAIEENSARLTEEIKQQEEKLAREQDNSENVKLQKNGVDRRLLEMKRQLQDKISVYEAMTEEMARLLKQADEYKSQIFELDRKINSDKAEINSLQMLGETLDRRQNTLLQEKDTGQDSNKETLDKLNTIKREKQEFEGALNQLRNNAEKKRKKFLQDQEEERALAKSVEELRISLGQLSARKKTIEEMESNYEGYNYAVKHVMKSGLRGIHGVVADLIKVPEGYEMAMETALGAAIQNIVCDDDASAKEAIKSLKVNKAGRMTFLPVDSIRGRMSKDDRLSSEQGFLGFGPECVEFDSKYASIADYLLGRVILVDNMDNAVRMSKKGVGFRFVTLEGEVINASGAITGGKYKNKSANILDRKAEIVSMEREIAQKTVERKKWGERLDALRKDISSFGTEVNGLEEEIRAYERKVLSKDNEVSLSESMLRDIKTSGDKLRKELENIRSEKDNSAAMIQRLKTGIEKNYIAIKEAEKLSEEKLDEYNGRKTLFDKINEDITEARINLNTCENEQEHADEIYGRIEAVVEELRADIKAKGLRLDGLKGEKDRITLGTGDSGALLKAKEEEKFRLDEYMDEVTEEKAQVIGNLALCNAEKEESNSKLESLQNQKYELEIKKAKNETQLETYKDRLWDDFEISYIQAMEFKNDEFVMSSAVKENRQIKNRMKELGEVNVGAIEEYETVRERYEFLTGQQADIQKAMDNLNKIIEDMDKAIKIKFKESFDKIVVNFEEKFQELFGGGHAELRLSDENNPLESNIDIVAQPPGKKLQNINLLSGGEKTLTAIALMFAVLKAKPTPFCILDEVEAALDDNNIDRFISCLRKLMGIQFTLVTHQKATMEHADVLYGVTMPEKGVSKVLSLNLEDDFEI
ncbi:MAG: chromosome segregation protein SMC [Clostridiales bacterium]|nr:chromosome segregation protein SMC [Clostridiales bacterium]